MSKLLALTLAALMLLLWPVTRPAQAQELTVFAAASLTDAMEEIGRRYPAAADQRIDFAFASSSTLARQLEAGAPAQIFASASETWMDYVEERGLIEPQTRVSPIGNRLIVIAPTAAARPIGEVTPKFDLAGLLGRDGWLAIGDPGHVPAGIYAKEALERLALWDDVESRLAYTDNVRAVVALVERGEASLGIVYATDAAVSERVVVVGQFPAESHGPISYPFAIVRGQAGESVRALFRFMIGEPGLAIFERHGFVVVEE
jgi:molybdate transport system substrate-binding protein